jgi:hypothetical protein
VESQLIKADKSNPTTFFFSFWPWLCSSLLSLLLNLSSVNGTRRGLSVVFSSRWARFRIAVQQERLQREDELEAIAAEQERLHQEVMAAEHSGFQSEVVPAAEPEDLHSTRMGGLHEREPLL